MSKVADFAIAAKRKKEVAKKYKTSIQRQMQANLMAQKIGVEGDLSASLQGKLGYEFGDVNRIGFRFLRYGAFVELGVGRGYPIETVESNRNSALGRRPKPWFNPPIESAMSPLADELVEIDADAAVKAIKIGKKA